MLGKTVLGIQENSILSLFPVHGLQRAWHHSNSWKPLLESMDAMQGFLCDVPAACGQHVEIDRVVLYIWADGGQQAPETG